MRFLIISKPKHMVPPELVPGLIDAFSAYLTKYTESGKIEQSWSFAGIEGGGGIFNVDSPEELDALVQEYPFGVFSDIEIYSLVDLQESLQRSKAVVQAMMAGMG